MTVQSIDFLISAAPTPERARAGERPVFQIRIVESPNGRLESPADFLLTPDASGYRFVRNGTSVVIPDSIDGVSDAEHAKIIGTALYNALVYDDRLQELLTEAIGGARALGSGARLRFQIEPRAMRRLPLELLYREAEGFMSMARDLSIARYLAIGGQPIRTLITPLPLHVLIVTFAPRNLPTLNVEAEIRRVRDGLSPLEQAGIAAVHELRDPPLDVLRRTLREQRIQVLHHIGHGDYRTEIPLLALTKPDGSADFVTAETYALNIAGADPLRLVIFNACDTAIQSTQAALIGVAPQVMAMGNIPAVIAMGSQISDASAIAFSQGFYRALGSGADIDSALRDGRIAIFNRTGSKNTPLAREFAIPILFLRPADARLIDFPEQQAARILENLSPSDGQGQAEALAALYTRISNWKSVHDLLQQIDTTFSLVEIEIERIRAEAIPDLRFVLRGWSVCRGILERIKGLARDPASLITVTSFSEHADGAIAGDAWVVGVAAAGRGIDRALESEDMAALTRESRAMRRAIMTHLNVSDQAIVDTNRAIQAIDVTFSASAAAELRTLHQRLEECTAIHTAINSAAAVFRPVRDLVFQQGGDWSIDRVERTWSYTRSNALDSRLFPEAEARGDLARGDSISGAEYAVELLRAAEGIDQAIQLAEAAPHSTNGAEIVRNAVRTFDNAIGKHAYLADQTLIDLTVQLRALSARLTPLK